jgi:hypothetical protein
MVSTDWEMERPMITEYTFMGSGFGPTAGELDEGHGDYINPGVFARALAEFLIAGLVEEGYAVKARVVEDWGNWIELEHDGPFALAVCCSNIEDGAQGWTMHRVSTDPAQPYVRKLLRKIHVQPDVERLSASLARILGASDRITGLKAA